METTQEKAKQLAEIFAYIQTVGYNNFFKTLAKQLGYKSLNDMCLQRNIDRRKFQGKEPKFLDLLKPLFDETV